MNRFDQRRRAPAKIPFHCTRQFRGLVTAVVLVSAAAITIIFEILPALERGGVAGASATEVPGPIAEPDHRDLPRGVVYDGLLSAVHDGAPIGERGPAYERVLESLIRSEAGSFPGAGVETPNRELLRDPARHRGDTVRITALFLYFETIRLERSLFGREWIHRAYLASPRGDAGWVVDLLEEPQLERRALARVDAIFLRSVRYAAREGERTAPLLLGRRLERWSDPARAESRSFSAVMLGGTVVAVLAAGIATALLLSHAGRP